MPAVVAGRDVPMPAVVAGRHVPMPAVVAGRHVPMPAVVAGRRSLSRADHHADTGKEGRHNHTNEERPERFSHSPTDGVLFTKFTVFIASTCEISPDKGAHLWPIPQLDRTLGNGWFSRRS